MGLIGSGRRVLHESQGDGTNLDAEFGHSRAVQEYPEGCRNIQSSKRTRTVLVPTLRSI